MGYAGGLGDQANDVLHLGPQPLDFVEVDRACRGEHFVDRVVHRTDQRGDRAAVERRQERLADGGEDVANNVVGDMLPVLDGPQALFGRAAIGCKLLQCVRSRRQHRGVRFEHAEEVARLREQALKPTEHGNPLRTRRVQTGGAVSRSVRS